MNKENLKKAKELLEEAKNIIKKEKPNNPNEEIFEVMEKEITHCQLGLNIIIHNS